MQTDNVKAAFAATYHREPAGVVRAPGRVNLIGEHTDYNDGFVLPIAIDRQTLAASAPRDDAMVVLTSLQGGPAESVNVDAAIVPGANVWTNYPKGVAAGLLARGIELRGADILFDSDVPIGGGLSSSASLEVAAAMAMLAAAGKLGAVPDDELAKLCQHAENTFAGAPCGIMDQSIAVMGRAGQALLLDCRNGATRQIPFDDPNVVLLVADTQVKHDIADGGYAARREQCHTAAAKLGVAALRDAAPQRVESAGVEGVLSAKELMRARHVVGEIARTLTACDALGAGDYAKLGELMYASHASLRDDYEVSCEELDAIVDLAHTSEGVHGARMTGGGFGGCAIILARAAKSQTVSDTVAAGFEKRFARRPPIFTTRACAGASVVE